MTETPDFVLFLGRFHPLVVHLPIGFLFFAFLLELYSKWKKNTVFNAAIPLALFTGAVTATIASILGYMLSLSGDYDADAIDSHFWFGVATTIIAFIAWLIRIDKIKINKLQSVKANISTLALIVVLLSITGHYGGNLTHGSDYLTKYAPFGKVKKQVLKPVENVEDAEVYAYLVKPILENKCTSCHNSDKKKGGLMLHDSISILRGGKNGDAFVAGNATKSEMIRRVLLNPHHDDFMPPEGKTPLTEEETAILTYWINNAEGNFSKKLGAVTTPENISVIAADMLGLGVKKKGDVKLPTTTAIDDVILQEVLAEGFNLRELVFESNLYEVSLPSKTISSSNIDELKSKLDKLLKIKDHILWFSIDDNFVSDTHLETINQFQNLQKLVLNNNPISDVGIAFLENLTKLKSLNLYSTNITNKSLNSFSKIKNLEKVYAWKTKINQQDIDAYQSDTSPKVLLGQ